MSRALLCSRLAGVMAGVGLLSGASLQSAAAQYAQTNLSSSVPGLANNLDPNLVNPTGMAFGPTSPIWIANQDAESADVLQGNGLVVPLANRVDHSEFVADGCSLQSQFFV